MLLAVAIPLVIGLSVLSLFLNYLWEKWTSKKGTEEALKEANIGERLEEQQGILNQINQKLNIDNLPEKKQLKERNLKKEKEQHQPNQENGYSIKK